MNETENIKSYKLIQSRRKRIINENSCSVMTDKNAAVIWSIFFFFFLSEGEFIYILKQSLTYPML